MTNGARRQQQQYTSRQTMIDELKFIAKAYPLTPRWSSSPWALIKGPWVPSLLLCLCAYQKERKRGEGGEEGESNNIKISIEKEHATIRRCNILRTTYYIWLYRKFVFFVEIQLQRFRWKKNKTSCCSEEEEGNFQFSPHFSNILVDVIARELIAFSLCMQWRLVASKKTFHVFLIAFLFHVYSSSDVLWRPKKHFTFPELPVLFV